jgi:hypothetical protein
LEPADLFGPETDGLGFPLLLVEEEIDLQEIIPAKREIYKRIWRNLEIVTLEMGFILAYGLLLKL